LLDATATGHAAAATEWLNDQINCTPHEAGHDLNQADEDYDDLTNLIDSQDEIVPATKTVNNAQDGTVDVDSGDITFTAVTSGSTMTNYVYRKYNATGSLSELIARFDTDSGGPISIVTNDGDIIITQPAGGIFYL
jgi:hypothetical protein